MLILFCCCFFFKLTAKDSVLLLLKPMGFSLCWLDDLQAEASPRVLQYRRHHFGAGSAKVTGSPLHPTQTLWMKQHQCAETRPGEAL